MSPACLFVSQFLHSKARCCDAGCGVVSPACLPVSPKGLCGQMPDAVTLAAGSCLPLVSQSLQNPAKLAVSTVQPALVSWGKVLTRFRDGAGLELTFKAKLVPERSGVGRMEQSHALAILGARGALDTKEMKALDD